jgi:4-alpha-glucanotransferase
MENFRDSECYKMLICGEDLGMVPACVPVVMDELAIIALKVQRMPSENIPFYNPKMQLSECGYSFFT